MSLYKKHLALSNLQWLICHKSKPIFMLYGKICVLFYLCLFIPAYFPVFSFVCLLFFLLCFFYPFLNIFAFGRIFFTFASSLISSPPFVFPFRFLSISYRCYHRLILFLHRSARFIMIIIISLLQVSFSNKP